MKRKIALILSFAMLAVFAAGCAPTAPASDSSPAADKKVLKVATSADYPPYEFTIVGSDGSKEIVGFEMATIRYIGEQMGMEVEIVDMDFNSITAAIAAGTVDCGVAAMSATEERKKSVDFSDFYYVGEQAGLIRTEDKDKFTSLESLDGVKAGIQAGTIHEELAGKLIPNVQLVPYQTIPDLAMELKNKKVDIVVLDANVAKSYAKRMPELFVPEIPFPGGEDDAYAIAVKKGNTELLDKLNKAIADLKGSEKMSGWVDDATRAMDSNK